MTEEYNPENDLFDKWEALPQPVQDLLNNFGECDTYKLCDKLLRKLKPLGYTFDYYLDAQPYNLRTINLVAP